jgi:hypothetical protein
MNNTLTEGKEIKIPGPDHPITISPAEGKVRVTVAGRIVAESACNGVLSITCPMGSNSKWGVRPAAAQILSIPIETVVFRSPLQ